MVNGQKRSDYCNKFSEYEFFLKYRLRVDFWSSNWKSIFNGILYQINFQCSYISTRRHLAC